MTGLHLNTFPGLVVILRISRTQFTFFRIAGWTEGLFYFISPMTGPYDILEYFPRSRRHSQEVQCHDMTRSRTAIRHTWILSLVSWSFSGSSASWHDAFPERHVFLTQVCIQFQFVYHNYRIRPIIKQSNIIYRQSSICNHHDALKSKRLQQYHVAARPQSSDWSTWSDCDT